MNLNSIILHKCESNNQRLTCNQFKDSLVEGSEVNIGQISDTTTVVREVLHGKGSKVSRKVKVQTLKDNSTD